MIGSNLVDKKLSKVFYLLYFIVCSKTTQKGWTENWVIFEYLELELDNLVFGPNTFIYMPNKICTNHKCT